jgi:hypothetical protein
MSDIPLSSRTAWQLTRLALRLRDDPTFMSGVLAAYQKQEHLSDKALAQQLHIEPTTLARLALCKCPSSPLPEFANQVRQIATHIGADTAQLALIIRQVEALNELRARPQTSGVLEHEPLPAAFAPGLLAAARDRTGTEEDQANPPSEEDDQEPNETGHVA